MRGGGRGAVPRAGQGPDRGGLPQATTARGAQAHADGRAASRHCGHGPDSVAPVIGNVSPTPSSPSR
eukprot:4519086-Pleurochrysis_carterae.AAC.1